MKRKQIPGAGLHKTQFVEAIDKDFAAIIDLVRGALATLLNKQEAWCVDIEAIFADRVIVKADSGMYFSYPYTIGDNNQVQLGDPIQVEESFQPVQIKEAMQAGSGVFLEAVGQAQDGVWLIRVIRAGLSGNGIFYPDAVLREAAPLFNGARVFQKSDVQHIKGEGKDVGNLIGGLRNSTFKEGKTPDSGEVFAELVMIEPAGETNVKLREAYQRKLSGLFGFSIDADGKATKGKRNGRPVQIAQSISKVNSVDLIVEPGAGGELIRLVEAQSSMSQEDSMFREAMIKAIKAHKPGFDTDSASDEELLTAYREAISVQASSGAAASANADALAEIRLVEARTTARETIAACTLPQAAKDRLLTKFREATEPFTQEAVETAIKNEREYVAKFTESGRVQLGNGGDITVEGPKIGEMLDDFFAGRNGIHSFRECYYQITGDRRVTGRLEDCDRTRLVESLGAMGFREALDTSAFANVLGNSLRRSMLASYTAAVDFDGWRQLVNVVPVNDFRTNERTRFGGYGDLPIVAENGAYTALSSPTDEKATYAVQKRGGTEKISLEMIKNDDVGAIRQIPVKMGRAAKRTLAKFVFDFLKTNPVIYDTKNLFDATHNNLFANAFSAAEFAAHRLAMMKQAERDSNDRLGIGPKFIVCPLDLQEAVWNAFQRATNLDKTFIQSMVPTIVPVWYWTDANDFCTAADPGDIPGIEIGFLDGQQEPDLFVQDMPNVGSLFSNDQITYKTRHIYGGNVTDFRGFTKAVVP